MTKFKTVFVIRTYNGDLASGRAFTDRATAEFAANGQEMFSAPGSERLSVCSLELVEGDVEDFLALGGIGPKAKKKTA